VIYCVFRHTGIVLVWFPPLKISKILKITINKSLSKLFIIIFDICLTKQVTLHYFILMSTNNIQRTCYLNPETADAMDKLAVLRNRSFSFIVREFTDRGVKESRQEWQETHNVSISEGKPSVEKQWRESGAAEKFGE